MLMSLLASDPVRSVSPAPLQLQLVSIQCVTGIHWLPVLVGTVVFRMLMLSRSLGVPDPSRLSPPKHAEVQHRYRCTTA